MKFHEKPSAAIRVDTSEQIGGWTDMTKLIIIFRFHKTKFHSTFKLLRQITDDYVNCFLDTVSIQRTDLLWV
jgi:hypothetical protein